MHEVWGTPSLGVSPVMADLMAARARRYLYSLYGGTECFGNDDNRLC